MGTIWVVTCEFSSPLHIGEPGIGLEGCQEYCPSDTLFSGLVNAWALAFGKRDVEETLLRPFLAGSPPFRLSSAFPFTRGQGDGQPRRFFLPRPATRPGPEASVPLHSELKKDIRFVEAGLFRLWLAGRLERPEDYETIQQKPYEPGKQLLPRLRLDRGEGRSQLYFVGRRYFAPGAGLYCFLEIERPEVETGVRTAFEILGEQGLGGERAVGCGRFRPQFLTPQETGLQEILNRPASPCAYCLLSLYAPSDAEWRDITLDDLESYRLVERGGFVDSPFLMTPGRRKRSWMLQEGSILRREPQGMLLDVTPSGYASHRVYRYGLGFSIAFEGGTA